MRATFEILAPVPIGRMQLKARVARGGQRVEMVEAELRGDGEIVMRARGWRVRCEALELDVRAPPDAELPGPGDGEPRPFFPTGVDTGYHTAMDVRFVHGGFTDPGPALAWMRMATDLVEGEPPHPRDRVLVASDSGNGVSAPLDYRRWLFVNTDLSVALRRLPRGDWVGLDSVTYAEADGTGISDTQLRDEGGVIGRVTQTLLVAPRA